MLPLQYPDSCVFIELFSNEKKSKKQLAQTYIYNIDKKYNVIISNLTCGEVYRSLMKMFDKDQEREMAFHKVNDILKHVEICSSQFEDYELALELKKIDYKLEPADALHLAMAINRKSQAFITIGERELVNNERIIEFCKGKNLKIESLG